MILVVVCGGVVAFVLWSTQRKIEELKEDVIVLRWTKVEGKEFHSFTKGVEERIELLAKDIMELQTRYSRMVEWEELHKDMQEFLQTHKLKIGKKAKK